MNDRLQEAIRLVLETEGLDGIDKLRDALGEVGDVSAQTVGDTERLIDSLNELNDVAGKAKRYGELSTELERTERALDQASNAAYQLTLQLGATDKPSRELVKSQALAREEVDRLKASVDKQWQALQRADDELGKLGFNTSDLAKSQVELRNSVGRTTTALAEQVDVVRKQSDAQRQLRERLAAGDAEFRKFAQAGRVSAEALAAYRARAAAAAEETRKLEGTAGGLTGAFGKLRGVLAGAAAYFGFREAARGVGNLLKVGAAAEDARRSLQNLYGGQEAGNKAFEQLKALAKQNGQEFQSLVDNAKKLKAFGLDPLNGSLQALIDQNAAVGGSQEDLSGKVLALGQAWAKQRLQGEEILQLQERGVPVLELLTKITGKYGVELQKLIEGGKLGRDVIKALYEEIGAANAGAAQRGLTTLSGLFQQVSARWTEFLNRIAESGLTDYFKREVGSLLGSTRNLDGVAKRVADAIIGTIEALKRFALQIGPVVSTLGGFTLSLLKHAEAILFVGKVYAGLKIAQIAQQFGAAAVATQTATAAAGALGTASAGAAGQVGLLGRALAFLPRLLRISIATVGIEAAISLLTSLNGLMQERQKQLIQDERASIIQKQIQQELITSGKELANVYAQYASVAVQGGQQISLMTRTQALDYQFALTQAQNYYRGLALEAKAAGNAQAEAAALDKFDALGKSIQNVTTRLSELATTAAKENALDAYVTKAVENFDKLATKGVAAGKAISGALSEVNLTSPKGAEQLVSILDQVAARGTDAAKAITEELRAAVNGLSDEDFPRFQKVAEEAMKAGSLGAKILAEELNSINLNRLGVDIEAIKTGFTRTGRAVVDQFKASIREVDKLGLTAAQKSQAIATAFDNAFAKASTSTELAALKRALQDAVSAGSLGFIEYQQRVDEVNAKLDELANKGKTAGKALNTGLEESGKRLREVKTKADDAAKSVEKIGDAGSGAASGLASASSAAQSLSFSISGVSEEYYKLLRTQNNWQLTKQLIAQQAELRASVAEVKKLNSEFDSLEGTRESLRKKFNLVDPTQVEELVQVEKTLEDNRKRRAEEQKRIADDAKRSAQEALDEARRLDAERAKAGLETLSVFRLEIVAAEGVGVKLINGGRVDPATARLLADAIAAPLLERIGRARDGSNQPRRRTR